MSNIEKISKIPGIRINEQLLSKITEELPLRKPDSKTTLGSEGFLNSLNQTRLGSGGNGVFAYKKEDFAQHFLNEFSEEGFPDFREAPELIDPYLHRIANLLSRKGHNIEDVKNLILKGYLRLVLEEFSKGEIFSDLQKVSRSVLKPVSSDDISTKFWGDRDLGLFIKNFPEPFREGLLTELSKLKAEDNRKKRKSLNSVEEYLRKTLDKKYEEQLLTFVDRLDELKSKELDRLSEQATKALTYYDEERVFKLLKEFINEQFTEEEQKENKQKAEYKRLLELDDEELDQDQAKKIIKLARTFSNEERVDSKKQKEDVHKKLFKSLLLELSKLEGTYYGEEETLKMGETLFKFLEVFEEELGSLNFEEREKQKLKDWKLSTVKGPEGQEVLKFPEIYASLSGIFRDFATSK